MLDYGRGRCAVSHILTPIGMDLVHVDSSDRKFPQTRNVKLVCYWLKKEFLTKGNADLFIPWSCGKVFVIFTPSTWPNNPCVLILFVASSDKTEELTWSIHKKNEISKYRTTHYLLSGVGGGGNSEDFGEGGIIWFSGRTEGGSVVTNRVLRGGRVGPREIWLAVRKGNITILQSLRGGGEGAGKPYRHITRLPRR